MMIEHDDLVQGSDEWKAHRAKFFNASDAPAMMGVSPYTTRTQLIEQFVTGVMPEIDDETQKRFDDGHLFEAWARPIAEKKIGKKLYPKVGSIGKLSASFDGLTMDDSIDFEHKSLNKELRELDMVQPDEKGRFLPVLHRIQMEQQLFISGSEKCLFMASKWNKETGELIEERTCWYLPDLDLRAKIIAGWEQFELDCANHKPRVTKEMPKAEVKIQLPALFVNAQGAITDSNMEEFGVALASKMIEIRAIKLLTDQDFSNAKEAAKMLREQREKMVLTKAAMLEQTMTIGQAARLMDTWAEDMRVTALQLEKEVEKEDLAKKRAMVLEGNEAFSKIHVSLAAKIKGILLEVDNPDFAAAIKGKRSYTSMQDAIDTALALATSAATVKMQDIRAKLAWCKEINTGYGFLFSDLQQIVGKQMDDFQLLVTSRITEHKHNESVKLEAETTRIRLEEEAKAQAKARAEQDAVIAQAQVEERAKVEAERRAHAKYEAGMMAEQEKIAALQKVLDEGEAIEQRRKAAQIAEQSKPFHPVISLEPIKAPYTASDTREINVVILVPLNWEDRLDMLDYILEEVAADHWTWNFVEPS